MILNYSQKIKTRLAVLLGLFFLLHLSNVALAQSEQEKNLSFSYLESQFSDPGKEYGSAPLWVWNTKVTKKIIDDMMEEFKDKNFGGIFIHPRPGLITEYLSEDWFEMVDYTLKKGKELDLEVWIYDENSYPSGFAGGHVPVQMPESYNQGQMLHMSYVEELPDSTEQLYIVLKKENQEFKDITNNLKEELGKEGDYYLFKKENYENSPWYGGFSYVDLLVEGVTEKFIEVTMDGYERVMGDEFGKAVPGIFTDEPNIAVQGDGNIRWTPDLFPFFQKKWGYDLRQHLPSLFQEVGEWQKVRHNYFQVLLQLFIDRWSKPWNDYTEQKGIEWTGHYWEHGWPDPNHGGDNMAMYAWHQRPAIDMLFNQFNEKSPNAQFGNIRAVKELSSVANQLDRERTLSETYGGAGWEFTFEDMKRLGDWEYVLGVNSLNQHLSFMTIMGARKYDYPQSFSYHSPWWQYYGFINQYFARLSLALSRGEQINKILVLEPTTSTWMYEGSEQPNQRLGEIGQEFQSFVTTLEKAQVEYDLGSENIIKDHGLIKDGAFVVGSRSYTTVVIPPGTENLDSDTYELLVEYQENGGKILQFEKVKRIDGSENPEITSNLSGDSQENYFEELTLDVIQQHLSSNEITFQNLENLEGNLYHHRRKLEDGQIIFLANSSLEESAQGKIHITGKDALLLNLETGEILDYPEQQKGNKIIIDYDLFPAGSLLLFVSDKRLSNYPPQLQKMSGEKIVTGETTIEPIGQNVLTIDFLDLNLGDTLIENIHTYSAADAVYKHHGFKEGNPWNHSVQYKQNIVERDTFSAGSGFEAIYKFNIKSGLDKKSLKAVIERPELGRVLVNGKELKPISGKWWLDKSFSVFDIGHLVNEGINKIHFITEPMQVHAEVEPIYILGDFNLQTAEEGWTITEQKENLDFGSWKEQGMPMYGGEVSYKKTIDVDDKQDNYWVKLREWKGTVAVVKINGETAGVLSSAPYVQDISEHLKEDDNLVEVIIVGSLKNTLGPFHNNPEPGMVGPFHFRNVKKYPSGNSYQLFNYGLMEDFEIIKEEN